MPRVPSQQLMESVRRRLGGTATPMAARLALQAVARAIRDGLREDAEVRLAHFGTFRLKKCRPRRLLLPGTGQELLLPERHQLRFTSPRPVPSATQQPLSDKLPFGGGGQGEHEPGPVVLGGEPRIQQGDGAAVGLGADETPDALAELEHSLGQ